jgi:hypothetical protein
LIPTCLPQSDRPRFSRRIAGRARSSITVLYFRTKQPKSLRAFDVQGDIEGIVYIETRKDEKLVGDVRMARLIIEDGAYFKGAINIVKQIYPSSAA